MKTEEQVKEKMNEVARDIDIVGNDTEQIILLQLTLKTLLWVLD